jgi:hypothetical protein
MPVLSREILNQLIAPHRYPCISMYMPVDPAFPGEMQNRPRFEDLLTKAESEMKAGYANTLIRELGDKCRSLAGEREFWNSRLAGLAVFCSPDLMLAVDLPRPVRDTMIVADHFYTKPLIRELQTMNRYQVLCLTRKDVRLLEGDRDTLVEVPIIGVPPTAAEAYAMEGNRANASTGPDSRPGAHHPGTPDTGILNLDRWFRAVDQAIWRNHSRISHLPLILCAIPESESEFRRICKNEYLMDQGIQLDPDHIPLARIREEAWKVIEPLYSEKARQAVDNFRVAKAHHQGDDDVYQVAHRACDGKIQMLLVEADRQIGGKVDAAKREVLMGDISDPMLGDLLDDTAQTVLRAGGDVWVIPQDLMPTDTGMAAVYRY